MSNVIVPLKKLVLDLIFPSSCLGCQKEGQMLCQTCRKEIKFTAPNCFVCRKLVPRKKRAIPGRTCPACSRKTHIATFLSPFSYDFPLIRELIRQIKYQRAATLLDPLVEELLKYLGRFGIKFPPGLILVPIPLHPRRQRVRGFNQSEIIAKSLGTKLGLETNTNLLIKIKNAPPQTGLSAEERQKNAASMFRITDADAVKDKQFLLIDDVKTTGSTLNEAARLLKLAGAKRIWAMTIAH